MCVFVGTQEEDAGLYRCVVHDLGGTEYAPLDVFVGKPSYLISGLCSYN